MWKLEGKTDTIMEGMTVKKQSQTTTKNLGTGRDWAHGQGRKGDEWSEKWRRKDVNQKREPTGVDRGP